MFSLLNTKIDKGRDPAKVCKFLDSLSVFFHAMRQRFGRPFYLLEGRRLRDRLFLWVGLRIAFLVHLPAFARIRAGKA